MIYRERLTDEEVIDLVVRTFKANPSAVWTRSKVAMHADLGVTRLSQVLPKLVEGGHIVMVIEHFGTTPNALLKQINRTRSNTANYMLPARYAELVAARDKKAQE